MTNTHPTLLGVPLEARLHIYSYLLLESNVITYDAQKQFDTTPYTTALFTVNKQISSESLSYFYSSNVFIRFVTNMLELAQKCADAFPIVSRLKGVTFHAMQMDLILLESHDYPAGAINVVDDETTNLTGATILMTARNLPTLVRMINAEHMLPCYQGCTTMVDFRFHMNKAWFKSRPSVAEILVNGVKGLRKIRNPPPAKSSLKLRFHGDLDSENIKAIKKSTNPPRPTLEELIAEVKLAKERGNGYYKAGIYTMAQCEYNIALAHIQVPPEMQCEGNFDNDRIKEGLALCIKIEYNLSLVASQQKLFEKAITHAARAVMNAASWPRFKDEDVDDEEVAIRQAEVAKMLYRLGSALAENMQYEDAIVELGRAIEYAPQNTDFSVKLKDVKEQFKRQKKRSENSRKKAFH